MHNLYEQFRQLIPDPPLQAGTVIDVGSGVVTVALPGGGRIKARGSAASWPEGVRARRRHRRHRPQPDAGNHRDLKPN
jgi:hypothetical protein